MHGKEILFLLSLRTFVAKAIEQAVCDEVAREKYFCKEGLQRIAMDTARSARSFFEARNTDQLWVPLF